MTYDDTTCLVEAGEWGAEIASDLSHEDIRAIARDGIDIESDWLDDRAPEERRLASQAARMVEVVCRLVADSGIRPNAAQWSQIGIAAADPRWVCWSGNPDGAVRIWSASERQASDHFVRMNGARNHRNDAVRVTSSLEFEIARMGGTFETLSRQYFPSPSSPSCRRY
ncbi:MAG: hypothetical protein H6993_09990 [Pseudomonadales bacterium]|nr:hypothetical protein [Pseudomonadales bacterium]MCP5184283.1 hypothetical protein [Pseudomonadales bacterium]